MAIERVELESGSVNKQLLLHISDCGLDKDSHIKTNLQFKLEGDNLVITIQELKPTRTFHHSAKISLATIMQILRELT